MNCYDCELYGPCNGGRGCASQHYCDLNPRQFDWQDRIVMYAGCVAGGIWIGWIVEGLLR
jgi:hypothetical protein